LTGELEVDVVADATLDRLVLWRVGLEETEAVDVVDGELLLACALWLPPRMKKTLKAIRAAASVPAIMSLFWFLLGFIKAVIQFSKP
jgi:hypothetical protein